MFNVGQYFAIKTSVNVRNAFCRLHANKAVLNKTTLFSLAGKNVRKQEVCCDRKRASVFRAEVMAILRCTYLL